MAKPKTNTKAAKAAQGPTDDQPNAGVKAQTGPVETPAPATDTPPPTENQAKAGATDTAAPAEKMPETETETETETEKAAAAVETRPEADPADVTAAVSGGGMAPETRKAVAKMATAATEQLARRIRGAQTADVVRDPMDEFGPDHLEVTVVGPVKGFRRAGMGFGPTPTTFGAETITRRQFIALENEPMLIVSLAEKTGAWSAE